MEVVLDLAGTTALALAPIAGATRMTLKGDWPHPSFGGRFLPVVREVRDDGFQAAWQIPSLATTAPDDFARHAVLCAPSAPDTADEAAPRDGPGAQAKRCIETFDVAFIPSSTR